VPATHWSKPSVSSTNYTGRSYSTKTMNDSAVNMNDTTITMNDRRASSGFAPATAWSKGNTNATNWTAA
jgi:hypothetical protein